MLAECKLALRVTEADYDAELCALICAAVRDLEIAGVVIPGKVEFSGTEDTSTLTDPLVMRAIITYVRANFGTPPDYEQLNASYKNQREQLANATNYTSWDGDT